MAPVRFNIGPMNFGKLSANQLSIVKSHLYPFIIQMVGFSDKFVAATKDIPVDILVTLSSQKYAFKLTLIYRDQRACIYLDNAGNAWGFDTDTFDVSAINVRDPNDSLNREVSPPVKKAIQAFYDDNSLFLP